MFDEIRRIIPKSSWPWFYLAIQQDDTIRQQLSNDDFTQLAIERLGKDPSAWSPGALALIALDLEKDPAALRQAFPDASASIDLPADLIQKAVDFTQQYRSEAGTGQPSDLSQAGLLALGMYLSGRENGLADILAGELKRNATTDKDSLFYTACACLYDYLPEPRQYLTALVVSAPSSRSEFACDLVVHVLLSQPLSPECQKEVVEALIAQVAVETGVDLLRSLHAQRAQLAAELAESFITSHPDMFEAVNVVGKTLPLQEQLALLDRIQAASAVFGMAGHNENAEILLEQAEILSRSLQAGLAKQRVYSSARKKGDPRPALEKLERMDEREEFKDGHTQALLALSLMDGGHYQSAEQIVAQVSEPSTADMALAQARLASYQDEFEAARQHALQALKLYADQQSATMKKGQEVRLQNAAQLRQLADLFMHLEFPYGPCPAEAKQAAELSLALQPAHADTLSILSQAERRTGNSAEALEAATLAVALAADNIEIKRVYAQALEVAGEWNSALENWKSITGWSAETTDSPDWRSANLSDLRSMAFCAIHTGQPAVAIHPLEHVLEYYPTDSEAHVMLGKAFVAQARSGDTPGESAEAGLEHIRQAIRLDPHNRTWFQGLSEALAASGRPAQALEAAQQALALAPGEVDNLAWFADQCIVLERPLDAVDALQWAIKLYPAEMNLQSLLAQVFLRAGQRTEALQILENVLAAPAVKLGDLSLIADCFLQLGEIQPAIQALERANVENQHAKKEQRFDILIKLGKAYAKAHSHQTGLQVLEKAAALKPRAAVVDKIKAGIYLDLNKPEKALKSLEHALVSDAGDGEAHALALDILRQSGDMPGALAHAQALRETENAWPARLGAAEFALQMLDLPLAEALLQGSSAANLSVGERARAMCLAAEAALSDGQPIKEIDTLKALLSGDLSVFTEDLQARLVALTARLDFKRAAYERALQVAENETSGAALLIATAEAALTMRDWEQGRALMRRAVLSAPLEARPALGLAQAYILTAEDQHLCEAVGVSANAPASKSTCAPLSREAQKECSESLRMAVDRAVPASLTLIERWGARAKAVFENSSKYLTSSSTPDEAAALMALLLRTGSPIPSSLLENQTDDWRVLVFSALRQHESNPALALQDALLAGERIPPAHPLTPIVHALIAGLASLAQDKELAGQALQKAIQVWQDEPAWLAGAARLAVDRNDVQAAVNYLDLALAGRPEDSDLRLYAARVFLEQADQPERAATLLHAMPVSMPIPAEFHALLAEALSRAGNYPEALAAYEKARASALVQEPAWETRLPIGMAETALRAGDRPLAIQTMQQAIETSPRKIELWQNLSNLFRRAGLIDSAMETAQKGLSLAPADLDAQLWFADQALACSKPGEAVSVLSQAVKLHPREINLYMRLARAQTLSGKGEDALATIKFAKLAPGSGFADLLSAAHSLLEFGEAEAALFCLERAKNEFPQAAKEQQVELLAGFTKAYLKVEKPQDALRAIQEAIRIQPEDREGLALLRAQTLVQLGKTKEATAVLSEAANAHPHDYNLRWELVNLLRCEGEIQRALEEALRLIEIPDLPNAMRLAAAELALLSLDLPAAKTLLESIGNTLPQEVSDQEKFLCLKAELAFLTGASPTQEITVAKMLASGRPQTNPPARHTHTDALEARFNLDPYAFQSATEGSQGTSSMEKIALGQAALSLARWNQAIDLLQQAIKDDPSSALAHLALAAALTSAAEAAPLYAAANASTHAPSQGITSQPNASLAAAALNAAAKLAPQSALPLIQRWQARSQAAFHNSLPDLIPLASSSPEDAAALSAAAARSHAPLPDTPFANHPLVLLSAAANLAASLPDQALPAAAAAAQALPQNHPFAPLAHALSASLSAINDPAAALASYQKAIAASPDEPAWLSSAADLAIASANYPSAAALFAKAVSAQPNNIDLRLHAAQALLEPANLPHHAATILQDTPDLTSAPPVLHAILAEALARSGSPDLALNAYRIALDSPLPSSPEWTTRLPIGFAHAAILNHQPPAAIATLQSALASSPNSPDAQSALWMALSSAFSAADLPSDALDAAHHALTLSPNNLDILLWFANQVTSLNSPQDAINALSSALESNPNHLGLITSLANALILTGLPDQALAILQRISDLPNPSLSDLLNAADSLLILNQPVLAINTLQRAQSASPDAPASQRSNLLLSLAKAYALANSTQQALDTLHTALSITPDILPQANLIKADLLAHSGNIMSAIDTLQQSLNFDPSHTPSHAALLPLLLAANNPAQAISHAHALAAAPNLPIQTRQKTGRFLYQMLDTEMALNSLTTPDELSRLHADDAEVLEQSCWLAEVALDAGQEGLAEDALRQASKIGADNPSLPRRVQIMLSAVQSRLAKRSYAPAETAEYLEKTLSAAAEEDQDVHALQFACEAAEELGYLEEALRLAEKMTISLNSPEARPFLILSRILVKMAETRRTMQPLHVTRHCPDVEILSEGNREKFNHAIRNCGQRLVAPAVLDMNDLPATLQRWWLRGRFAFDETPSPEVLMGLAKLPPNPEDTAAYVSALGRVENLALAKTTARDYPYDVQVSIALAGAYLEKQPRQALEFAEAALENQSEPLSPAQATILQALCAVAAQNIGEDKTAIQAYEKALAAWDDEAGWHDQVAQLYAKQGQNDQARSHLEKAVQLDGLALDPALRLGALCLEEEDYARSGEIFQRIASNGHAPLEAWHGLIRAAIGAGALNKAVEYAEKALKEKPDSLETHLLRAETALRMGEPRNAYQFARNALQISGRSVEAFRILSLALDALGQPEKALKALDRAVELSSDPLPFQLMRVQILRRQEGEQAALDALRALLEKYPDHASILANFAEILAKQGENTPALQAAQIALQNQEGTLTSTQIAELHSLAGRLLHRSGQLDQAIHHLSEAVRMNPDSLEACMELGMTYQERRQPAQALQVYRKAISLSPEDARPYYQAGLALKESRDFSGAEKMLLKAARLDPQDVRIQRLLGSVTAVNLLHGK